MGLPSEGEESMNLKPLGDRVVVQREEAQDKTAGGIVLPDTAKDKPQKGKVLAVGDGRLTKDGKRRDLQVKVGDSVLFTSYAGDEFKLEGDKKVLLMREDDILAVID
jgi:chaperonin GroES